MVCRGKGTGGLAEADLGNPIERANVYFRVTRMKLELYAVGYIGSEGYPLRDDPPGRRGLPPVAADVSWACEDAANRLSCHVSQSAWLARIREGDADAFRLLFDAHLDRVMRFMRRHSRSRTEAEDLTQAFFLRIWEKRGLIDPERSVEAFLFTVAHHLVVDHLRRTARRVDPAAALPDDGVRSDAPLPDAWMAHRQLEDVYHRAIVAMPPRRRDVFTLSREEGLSHQQIAQRLGISVRTVENHMSAALQSLREVFSRQDMGPAAVMLFFFLCD